jgi:hypothetical protein
MQACFQSCKEDWWLPGEFRLQSANIQVRQLPRIIYKGLVQSQGNQEVKEKVREKVKMKTGKNDVI